MHACIFKGTHLGRGCRFHKVIVRPDLSQADRAQGYVQAVDENAARAMLPQIDGLMLFDLSQYCHPEECGRIRSDLGVTKERTNGSPGPFH